MTCDNVLFTRITFSTEIKLFFFFHLFFAISEYSIYVYSLPKFYGIAIVAGK